ncbi:unnamed protein product [Ophioblennius macclurei]
MMAAVQMLILLMFAGVMTTSARRPRHAAPCLVVQGEAFCSDLSLSAAPVHLPPGVHMLDLSKNQVQNLTRETLAFQTGIRHLKLGSNKIRFIQPGLFRDMAHLKVLDLSRNHLNVFALSQQNLGRLASVESLDLSHNGLYTGMSDSFLADSPALANLSMESNSITKISQNTFVGSLGLRRISLRDNVILEIEDGAFDSLDHLSELDLSRNSISCITDFNLYNLQTLNLSSNSVELFHSAPSGFYKLLSLDLSQNKMLYFPLLPEGNMLEFLDVSHNRLQSVNVSGSADKDTNLIFNQLRFLDLSYNQLKTLPECFFFCMGQLQVLNVSHNCLPAFSVSDRDLLPRVRVVNLSFNALRTLTLGQDALQALEKLLLQGNRLRTLDQTVFRRLPSLRFLQLDQNRLEVCPPEQNRSDCVSLSSVRSLQYLHLAENRLRALPANAFADTPLKLLDLSLNPGLDLHRDSLSGLEHSLVHLLLRDNNMSSLDADLSSLRNLRDVDLSTNRLTALPTWTRESAIESLNLQNNNLVTLESSSMVALERSLKTLYMGSNPLSCCSNLDFLRLLQSSALVVPDLEAATCVHRERAAPVGLGTVTEDMCRRHRRRPVLPRWAVALLATLAAASVAALMVKCYNARKRQHSRSFSA